MDDLIQCNEKVGKSDSHKLTASGSPNTSTQSTLAQNGARARPYFPFKQGYLSVMTIRVGEEGIQMTVDGKHITSFAYREVIIPVSHLSFFPTEGKCFPFST